MIAVPFRGSPVHVGGPEVGEDLYQPGRALDEEDVPDRRARSVGVRARRGHEAAGVEPLLVWEPVEELEHREDDAVELPGEHAQHAGQDAPANVIQRAQLLLEGLLPAGQELVGIVWIGPGWPGDGLAGADRDEPVRQDGPPGEADD